MATWKHTHTQEDGGQSQNNAVAKNIGWDVWSKGLVVAVDSGTAAGAARSVVQFLTVHITV